MLNSFCKIQEATGNKKILIVILMKILLSVNTPLHMFSKLFEQTQVCNHTMLHRINLYTSVLPLRSLLLVQDKGTV